MDNHELKATWQALERRLQQRETIDLWLLKDRHGSKVRTTLRPLLIGQVCQILFGLVLLLLAVAYWKRHLDNGVLLSMGIILHAYGIACIVLAGMTIGRIGKVDPSQPVVVAQRALAGLRRFYIINGMITGLSWWFIWMPATTVIFGLLGSDQRWLSAGAYLPGTLIGVAGLLATWWFHNWSRSPERPRLAKAVENSVIGNSLQKSQRMLDELAAFERE